MTKILSAFIICFIALGLSACAHQQPTPKQLVFSNWHLEKRVLNETSENPSYQIEVKYPEIVGHPETASAQDLNQRIRTYIGDSIQTFKKTAPPSFLDSQDYPVQMRDNTLRITYSATLIKPRQHTIVSIRFATNTLFTGQITHSHYYAVMNYDLTEGKMLTLDSLFKPNSDYLRRLAQTCQKTLSERLAQGMVWMPWDYNRSLALPQNFKLWNLERRGLRITFVEEQVTPYSSVAQTILVPYPSLRSVLAPASPVSAYAYA